MFLRAGVWGFSARLRFNTITSSLKSFSTMPQRAALEQSRALPTSGYATVDADTLVEEEELPDYQADRFYPVQLGELFQDRYQFVAKLGFGSSSTTWLARDLR